MSHSMIEYTRGGIRGTHTLLLEVTEDLTSEQFNWRPGLQAPPIGWHIWHIARWADRVQIAFPARGDVPRRQIWEEEELVQRWSVDPSEIGPLQTGEAMDPEVAARLPRQMGQDNIMNYARRCFATFNEGMDHLTPEDIEWIRSNTQPYAVTEDRQLVPAPAKETPLASDLTYHANHASRHLGMIEALRGAQGLRGTATA